MFNGRDGPGAYRKWKEGVLLISSTYKLTNKELAREFVLRSKRNPDSRFARILSEIKHTDLE